MAQSFEKYLKQLTNPSWFPDPEQWVWERPDGQMQGLSAVFDANPGVFNLAALALGSVPEDGYSLDTHDLAMWVLRSAQTFKVESSDLAELATLLPPLAFVKMVRSVEDVRVRELVALAEGL